MGKKSIVKKSELRALEELNLIDVNEQDRLFFTKLDDEKIKELAAIVYKIKTTSDFTDSDITELTGLTESQINIIKKSSLYLQSVHGLVSENMNLVQTMLANSVVPITNLLIKQAMAGNMSAMKEFFKLVATQKKQEESSDKALQTIMAIGEAMGLKNANQLATDKILSDLAKDKDVIDGDFEELRGEDESSVGEHAEEISALPEDDDDMVALAAAAEEMVPAPVEESISTPPKEKPAPKKKGRPKGSKNAKSKTEKCKPVQPSDDSPKPASKKDGASKPADKPGTESTEEASPSDKELIKSNGEIDEDFDIAELITEELDLEDETSEDVEIAEETVKEEPEEELEELEELTDDDSDTDDEELGDIDLDDSEDLDDDEMDELGDLV